MKEDFKVWTTKDGRKVPVKDMETFHVENTIIMLRRKAQEMKKLLDELTEDLNKDPYSKILSTMLRVLKAQNKRTERWILALSTEFDRRTTTDTEDDAAVKRFQLIELD